MIEGEGTVLRITDLNQPMELNCIITTDDESVLGQWIQPPGSQPGKVLPTRVPPKTYLNLIIAKPSVSDAGRYICRAQNVEAHIDVRIDETASESTAPIPDTHLPYHMDFLRSSLTGRMRCAIQLFTRNT